MKAAPITMPMQKVVEPGVESMSSEGAAGGRVVIADVFHATKKR